MIQRRVGNDVNRIRRQRIFVHEANRDVTTIFGTDTRNQQIVTGWEIFNVETSRLVGKLASARAFAGKAKVANSFDAPRRSTRRAES